MRISFETARARWSFAFALVFVSAGSCFLAGKVWLAEHWGASPNPQAWVRAANLEPGDAAYWQHLGLYAEFDIDHHDANQAIAYLSRAAEINPRSAETWADLAIPYEELGMSAAARNALQRAQANFPISGDIAWRYGSFLERQGDFTAGLAQLRRAILVEPSLTTSAVAESWSASGDAASITGELLPATSRYYLAALGYFLSQKQDDPALVVWKGLLKLGQPIEMNQAIPLVNQLISENRVSEAETAWGEALQAARWPHQEVAEGSVVFNGGFEYEVANGGFDWQEEGASGVTYALDRYVTHSGKRSMRITFDGSTNLDFAHLTQFVPVKSKGHYRFKAYLRTQDITTDSGVRFLLYDARHSSEAQTLTPNLVGTNPWTLVESDISTGPDTDLLVVALRRIPSSKFDNKLAGTVWIDDVSMVTEDVALAGKPE